MKQTLLIADRDAELREALRRFLTSRGYEVKTSTDGLDCLAKLRQVTPAVLMLDLDLLWGGGQGVLAWLREESATHGIPVIIAGDSTNEDYDPSIDGDFDATQCPVAGRAQGVLDAFGQAAEPTRS